MDWLLDPFAGEIARRALAEVLLLATVCGPLGVWVVLAREAYAAESIGHGMLPGLAIAAVAGAPLAPGAAAGALVTVAVLAVAGRSRLGDPDTRTAVAVTALTGLGALIALSSERPVRLEALLFGDLLGTSSSELGLTAAVSVAGIVALTGARRVLMRGLFDGGSAPATVIVLAVLAATTAVAAPALGSLLLLALLLAPAAAALEHSASVVVAAARASAIGAAAGVCGLLASYHLEIAAGASVAACALLAWAGSSLLTAVARWGSIPART